MDLSNDDYTPYTRDPRDDPSIYPLTIQQEIYSTTDERWGREQHIQYKDVPEIKRLTICEISLGQEECMELDKVDDIGFKRRSANGQWSFTVPVRVTLQWHDVRASWTAEISKKGWFASDDSDPVWSKEIKFATVEHHGHKLGDQENIH